MPCLDKPLADLQSYLGISPKPQDFDAYWQEALADLDATDPEAVWEEYPEISLGGVQAYRLWFRGVGGARLHAKLLRPKQIECTMPALLRFHGYGGYCGDWLAGTPYVAAGWTVASLDCRGQGGLSEDSGAVQGTTMRGFIVRGLGDPDPRKMYYRQQFLDTVQLARVVRSLPWVNPDQVSCTGASQGGALSIACAALDSSIRKCVSVYPFLSDYRRVWEMDLVKNAYEELGIYFKQFDPLHEREEEIFTRLGYIDVANLAPQITCPTLMALSLQDNICPPSTQFAVFNRLVCPKQSLVYPDFGHDHLPGLSDREFAFLLAD